MSYVLYVPGLNGDKSIDAQFSSAALSGTNYEAVKETARMHEVFCMRSFYQMPHEQFPTLSRMGTQVATHVIHLNVARGTPGLIVASSVGAGVTLQALSTLPEDQPLPHVILFKPVIDPLDAIKSQLEAKLPAGMGATLLAELKEGKRPGLEIPVNSTDTGPEPGKFLLSKAHLDDPKALHLISDPESFAAFSAKLGPRKMGSLTLLVGRNDALTDKKQMLDFAEAARIHTHCSCKLDFLDGDEVLDRATLTQEVSHRLELMVR